MNGTCNSYQKTGAPVYTSRSVRRVPVGRHDYLISYGDRLSIRIVTGENTVMEYETCQVADLTDLTGDLRRRAKGTHGLATVNIRNHDRGWTRQRRIMLYPQRKFISPQKINAVQIPMFYPWEL